MTSRKAQRILRSISYCGHGFGEQRNGKHHLSVAERVWGLGRTMNSLAMWSALRHASCVVKGGVAMGINRTPRPMMWHVSARMTSRGVPLAGSLPSSTSREFGTLSTNQRSNLRIFKGVLDREPRNSLFSLVAVVKRGLSEANLKKRRMKFKWEKGMLKPYKLKTRKAAADRFFPVAGGLYKRWQAGKKKNATKKQHARKVRLRGSKLVTTKWHLKRLRQLMPYNIPKGFKRSSRWQSIENE